MDCLEGMKQIPDNTIDLVITSPPYDNLRTYDIDLDWGEHIWKPVIQELFRIVKEGGVVVWVVGDATINGSETGTSFRQALYFKEVGFNIHDTMIWEKPTFTATGTLQIRYADVFDYMFIFSKGKPKTFNPIKDRTTKGIRKKNGTVRHYRSSGHEVDFIRGKDAWEVKYKSTIGEKDLANIKHLRGMKSKTVVTKDKKGKVNGIVLQPLWEFLLNSNK